MSQDEGEPAAFAYYPTPGLTLMGTAPQAPFRGGITCSSGQTFIVSGNGVYLVSLATPGVPSSGVTFIHLGDITGGGAGLTTPVGMAENGAAVFGGTGTLVIVDGTTTGWSVTLGGVPVLAVIADPNFLGATHIDYVDTFFISNVPNTAEFQAGNSVSITWDPLFVASKVSHSDNLIALIVAKREIWLLGATTSEVWYNTGASDFPFQEMQGVFIDHGCAAKYSVAEMVNTVYWLSQDRRGQCMVLSGSLYQATRISTYAMEAEMAGYGEVVDAEGYTFQQGGHQFYVLSFPQVDKTWAYDILTKQWHRWVFTGTLGVDHKHLARQIWPAFNIPGGGLTLAANVLLAGDLSGNIYLVDPTNFTDNGFSIKRQRAFPHLINDANRQFYWQFIADMEVGNAPPGAANTLVLLDWSDDRGQTFGTPQALSLGAAGANAFLTSLQFQRLGMARDRVFRLTWAAAFETALQGAWVVVEGSEA